MQAAACRRCSAAPGAWGSWGAGLTSCQHARACVLAAPPAPPALLRPSPLKPGTCRKKRGCLACRSFNRSLHLSASGRTMSTSRSYCSRRMGQPSGCTGERTSSGAGGVSRERGREHRVGGKGGARLRQRQPETMEACISRAASKWRTCWPSRSARELLCGRSLAGSSGSISRKLRRRGEERGRTYFVGDPTGRA